MAVEDRMQFPAGEMSVLADVPLRIQEIVSVCVSFRGITTSINNEYHHMRLKFVHSGLLCLIWHLSSIVCVSGVCSVVVCSIVCVWYGMCALLYVYGVCAMLCVYSVCNSVCIVCLVCVVWCVCGVCIVCSMVLYCV